VFIILLYCQSSIRHLLFIFFSISYTFKSFHPFLINYITFSIIVFNSLHFSSLKLDFTIGVRRFDYSISIKRSCSQRQVIVIVAFISSFSLFLINFEHTHYSLINHYHFNLLSLIIIQSLIHSSLN
jgi:hypothetical protein